MKTSIKGKKAVVEAYNEMEKKGAAYILAGEDLATAAENFMMELLKANGGKIKFASKRNVVVYEDNEMVEVSGIFKGTDESGKAAVKGDIGHGESIGMDALNFDDVQSLACEALYSAPIQ